MKSVNHLNSKIRPLKFNEFIGQKKIKSTLKFIIGASKVKESVLPHILFTGLAGVGKTTLATIIANESNLQIRYTQGSMFEKKSDLLNVFTSLPDNCILFIDEIHSISQIAEELLYSIMEDFVIDIVLGVEANAKVVRMKIKPFTLIGATTKFETMSKPFRDRYGIVAKIAPYNIDDIKKIVANSAKKMNLKIDLEAIETISNYSQLTPRIANHLLARVEDYSVYKGIENIKKVVVLNTFNNLGLYQFGLNEEHIRYLKILNNVFHQKSASLEVLSGILSITKETINQEIEPSLLRYELIKKDSKGRRITEIGINYLQKSHKINTKIGVFLIIFAK